MDGAALVVAACGALGAQDMGAAPVEVSGCEDPGAPPCARVTGRLDADATLADREGSYRLTLVRDGAAGHRTAVCGGLTLRRRTADAPGFGAAATPLHGFTHVDLEGVGAYRAGDAASAAVNAPGVLVLETDGAQGRSILLRLGATANRPVLRFDGAYTVLDVRTVSGGGFSGTWRSGAAGKVTVRGWFCARVE